MSTGIAWAAQARAAGYQVSTRNYGSDAVIIVRRHFTPGDADTYVRLQAEAEAIVNEAPAVTYGSTWGTTSDSVGGHAGLTQGYVEVLRSGVSKRFASGILAGAR